MKNLFFIFLFSLCTSFANAEIIKDMNTPINWSTYAIYTALEEITTEKKYSTEHLNDAFYIINTYFKSPASATELCQAYISGFYNLKSLPPTGCAEFISTVIEKHNQYAHAVQKLKTITMQEPYQDTYWDKHLLDKACFNAIENIVNSVQDQIEAKYIKQYTMAETLNANSEHVCKILNNHLDKYTETDKTIHISVYNMFDTCNTAYKNNRLFNTDIIYDFCYEFIESYTDIQNQQIESGAYNNVEAIVNNLNHSDINKKSDNGYQRLSTESNETIKKIQTILSELQQLSTIYNDPNVADEVNAIEAKLSYQGLTNNDIEEILNNAIILENRTILSIVTNILDFGLSDDTRGIIQPYKASQWRNFENERHKYIEYIANMPLSTMLNYTFQEKQELITNAEKIIQDMKDLASQIIKSELSKTMQK